MPLILWKDSFVTKVKFLDEEHEMLIGIVNELHFSMLAGKGKPVMGEVLGLLVNHTKKHFDNEEAHMRKTKYTGYYTHLQEHQYLLKYLTDFHYSFNNTQVIVSIELLDFLRDWLLHHIEHLDMQLGCYLLDHGVS